MSGGPRSARRLVDHRHGRLYGGFVHPPPPAAAPAGTPAADADTTEPLPQVSPAAERPLGRAQRRALGRRAWAWRLITGAWLLVTVLAGYVAVRWFGPAGACCPLVMAGPVCLMLYAAGSDVRQYARALRDGGD